MNEIRDTRLYGGFSGERASGDGGQRLDLGSIAEQLSAIAAELRGEGAMGLRLARGPSDGGEPDGRMALRRARPQPEYYGDLVSRRAIFAEFAREAYATRRRRATIFGNSELFGEPAWDILLDLYIAHAEKKPVSVSSACIGSAAPPTTGLRWLGVLAEHDLVMREHDPEDQRRVLVRLTERGLTAMDVFFASAGLTA